MKYPELTWLEPDRVDIPQSLSSAITDHPLVLEALVRRGITHPEHAQAFLNPSLYNPAQPTELPDLDKAATRLLHAIHQKERITIWGDFDVDGQTATTLLAQSLTILGANFDFYLPMRSRESHGINPARLAKMIKNGTQVLLTCDTGITAHDAAQICQHNHIDMLITDHHTLPEELPNAFALVNPQMLPNTHPLRPLCGVGTAYQLAVELFTREKMPEESQKLLDLVALGTVADLASLTGDNRYLVQMGLKALREGKRPALNTILSLSSTNPAQVNEEHLGFTLAPRLNALGRLGDANPVVNFLLAEHEDEVKDLAQELEGVNARRKLLCDQVFKAALARLEQNRSLLEDEILVLDHEKWPAGVIGIVASRLVQLFQRPVILLAVDPGGAARASARSVEGINITEALAENQSLLSGFGGHAMAAGFSMPGQKIPEFRRAINRTIHQMTSKKAPVFELPIDGYLSLDQINLALVESIDHLAPFGPGNPPIILACRNLMVKSSTPIGKTREHLQVIVEDSSANHQKVLWWQGAGLPLPVERFDLAFSVRATNFRGQSSVQLEWISARETAVQDLSITTSRITINDLRGTQNPHEALKKYQNQPGTVIWCEGENSKQVNGVDRYNLTSAKNLVLWNIPPGRSELVTILQVVKAEEIIVFGVPSGDHQPAPFLNCLAGLVRYSIHHQEGQTSIRALAAATAQTEVTVEKGLAWMKAKGFIDLTLHDNLVFINQTRNIPDPGAIPMLEKDITDLLGETAAFRKFFIKSNLQPLLEV